MIFCPPMNTFGIFKSNGSHCIEKDDFDSDQPVFTRLSGFALDTLSYIRYFSFSRDLSCGLYFTFSLGFEVWRAF